MRPGAPTHTHQEPDLDPQCWWVSWLTHREPRLVTWVLTVCIAGPRQVLFTSFADGESEALKTKSSDLVNPR